MCISLRGLRQLALATMSPGILLAQLTEPAVRQLEVAAARESAPFRSIAAIRSLPDGGVLLNDPVARRVVLLDSMLRVIKVVADTSATTQRAYGSSPDGLVAYRGDSSLIIDAAALRMYVVDGRGNIARVLATPPKSVVDVLVGRSSGNPGIDRNGRLVFRSPGASRKELIRLGGLGGPQPPDSAALLRFDLGTRLLDTAAFIRVYSPRIVVIRDSSGSRLSFSFRPVLNPAPVVDDWAVLSNGSIGIIRGQDYRAEYIDEDGRRRVGSPIPFERLRMTPAFKAAFIRSSKALRAKLMAEGAGVGPTVAPTEANAAVEALNGSRSIVTAPHGQSTGTTNAAASTEETEDLYVSPSELPDDQPVFAVGGVRAGSDGTMWIRTIATKPNSGGAVYDVIGEGGDRVGRVQVPPNTAVIGYGSGGIVYLGKRDASGVRLLRAH